MEPSAALVNDSQVLLLFTRGNFGGKQHILQLAGKPNPTAAIQHVGRIQKTSY